MIRTSGTPTSTGRAPARVCAVVATAIALVLVGAAPAWAHVRVSSTGAAAPGSYANLTFRVPTEKDDASTIALQVFMPTDRPLASVSVQPHPGWRVAVHKKPLTPPLQTDDGPVTEVVTDVVWTAESPQTAIAPGQFDQFSVLAGPLPDVPALAFPAGQTYSDREVVRWNQSAAAGAPEPEHPSPVLTLTAAGGGGDTPSVTATPAEQSSGTPLVLSVIAVVVAVVALAGLVVALLRGRRS